MKTNCINSQIHKNNSYNDSYVKAQEKREKSWRQTQTLDDIGTICLIGGLFMSPGDIFVHKKPKPTRHYIGNILLGIGFISVLAAMIKRATN